MGKVSEEEASKELAKRLRKFLRLKGKEREDFAKEMEDFVSFDLMEYNSGFEDFSDGMKHSIERLLNIGKWKGDGIRYGKELAFGAKDVREIIEGLGKRKMKA